MNNLKPYQFNCESGRRFLIIAPSADIALWKFCNLDIGEEVAKSIVKLGYDGITTISDKDMDEFKEHKGAFGI